MIDFILLPREGCNWNEVQVLTPEQFKAACEAGPKRSYRQCTPCALGWAYEWCTYDVDGETVRAPVGLVYDHRVADSCGGDGSKGWRKVGPCE